MSDYLSVEEVAKLLNVSSGFVRNWIAQGLLEEEVDSENVQKIPLESVEVFAKNNKIKIFPTEFLSLDRLKILIVDDDESFAQYLEDFCNSKFKKCQIKAISDGLKIKDIIQSFHPNIVILDLNMPGIDGFEICKFISHSPSQKTIKILAMSGDHSEEYRKKILALGANVFLPKPMNPDFLIHTLSELYEELYKEEGT